MIIASSKMMFIDGDVIDICIFFLSATWIKLNELVSLGPINQKILRDIIKRTSVSPKCHHFYHRKEGSDASCLFVLDYFA